MDIEIGLQYKGMTIFVSEVTVSMHKMHTLIGTYHKINARNFNCVHLSLILLFAKVVSSPELLCWDFSAFANSPEQKVVIYIS